MPTTDQPTDVQERDDQPTEQPTTTTTPEDHLEDPGKRAIQAEREARRAAEREAAAAKAELEKRDKAEAAAKAKQAEQDGKWEELARERESTLAAAKTDLESVTAERDVLKDLVKADVDAQWGELPEEVRKAYDGDDDDALAKKQHMQRMKPIIDRLVGDEEQRNPGNPRGPKPTGRVTTTEEDEAAKRRMRPRF